MLCFGASMLSNESGRPWAEGYCDNPTGKLYDKLCNGEVFNVRKRRTSSSRKGAEATTRRDHTHRLDIGRWRR